jgi:hypothetical protein
MLLSQTEEQTLDSRAEWSSNSEDNAYASEHEGFKGLRDC